MQSKCSLPLKARLIPHHSASSLSLISCGFLCGSWHSWIWSLVISPLEWEHWCRPDNLRKILKGCGESRGMHQRQKIFMAGKAVTTSLERQTICFSEGDCNIDAVFIRLIIAKHRSIQIFSCLLGCVWNLRLLKYFRSLLKKEENNKSKFCSA